MREERPKATLPKGVTQLSRSRQGRQFLATIRQKGNSIHLGLYETAALAGFAFNLASEAIGRGSRPPNDIAPGEQPDAETVATITRNVRLRLGLSTDREGRREHPPDLESLLVFFEVTVVGFWRSQAEQSDPGGGFDAVGYRLAEAARLIFWSAAPGHPLPTEVLRKFLGRRLDQAFRRSDLIRAILDDDGDDDWRIARWLAYPDVHRAARGFVDEVRFLYPEKFEETSSTGGGIPHWAIVLQVDPPFDLEKIKAAYRARSRQSHPDAGGSHQDFIRLQNAYEAAREYCRVMKL